MRTNRILQSLVAALTLALVAASCSTGGGDTATGQPTTTASTPADEDTLDQEPTVSEPDPDVPRTASFRGVTEDTIQIGVGYWDTSAFGFGFYGDTGAVWDALIGAVNDAGGVNGRTLEATIAGFNPADNAGMLEACTSLTEDAKVFAVLGGMRGDANFCIFEQHETILIGSQVGGEGEALERTRAPIGGFFPAGSTREVAFVEALADQGWFDGVESLGLHYDGNVTSDRVDADVQVILRDIGVDVAVTFNIDDLVLDEDTLETQSDIMREQARDAGVDSILILGAAATGYFTYGELGIPMASSDSDNFTTAVSGGIDPALLDGTIASTVRLNLATDDIDAETQQCLDDAQAAIPDARFERPAAGVDNSEEDPNYWIYTIIACRDLSLFVQVATAAGVDLTNDSFQLGLESLASISLPEIPFVSFGPGRYNGGNTVRLVEFDADADEDGELVAIGEPIDLS